MSARLQRHGIDRCGRLAGAGMGEMLLRDQRTGRLQPIASIDFGLPDDFGDDDDDLDLGLWAMLGRERS
ncbi:MAG: hypothetical protein EXQ87_03265 [Alphaproteobacteria bacterium]|nr:hypothetical protein [Alphaproteobacteria bacterium]